MFSAGTKPLTSSTVGSSFNAQTSTSVEARKDIAEFVTRFKKSVPNAEDVMVFFNALAASSSFAASQVNEAQSCLLIAIYIVLHDGALPDTPKSVHEFVLINFAGLLSVHFNADTETMRICLNAMKDPTTNVTLDQEHDLKSLRKAAGTRTNTSSRTSGSKKDVVETTQTAKKAVQFYYTSPKDGKLKRISTFNDEEFTLLLEYAFASPDSSTLEAKAIRNLIIQRNTNALKPQQYFILCRFMLSHPQRFYFDTEEATIPALQLVIVGNALDYAGIIISSSRNSEFDTEVFSLCKELINNSKQIPTDLIASAATNIRTLLKETKDSGIRNAVFDYVFVELMGDSSCIDPKLRARVQNEVMEIFTQEDAMDDGDRVIEKVFFTPIGVFKDHTSDLTVALQNICLRNIVPRRCEDKSFLDRIIAASKGISANETTPPIRKLLDYCFSVPEIIRQFVLHYLAVSVPSKDFTLLILTMIEEGKINSPRDIKAIMYLVVDKIDLSTLGTIKINLFLTHAKIIKDLFPQILFKNLLHFIAIDGAKIISDILYNHQLSFFPEEIFFLKKCAADFIDALAIAVENIDVDKAVLMAESFITGEFQLKVDTAVKQAIRIYEDKLPPSCILSDDRLSQLLLILKDQSTVRIKTAEIQQRLIGWDTTARESQATTNYDGFVRGVITIDLKAIQTGQLEQLALKSGIHRDKVNSVLPTMEKYMKWSDEIGKLKKAHLALMQQQILANITILSRQSHDLCFSYVMNVLPFLNAYYIHEFIRDHLSVLPKPTLSKLQLVLKVHNITEGRELDYTNYNSSADPLLYIVVQEKNAREENLTGQMQHLISLAGPNCLEPENMVTLDEFALISVAIGSGVCTSRPPTRDDLRNLVLPVYLANLIGGMFAFSAKIAEHITGHVTTQFNGEEYAECFRRVIAQVTSRPTADITLPTSTKKEIMEKYQEEAFAKDSFATLAAKVSEGMLAEPGVETPFSVISNRGIDIFLEQSERIELLSGLVGVANSIYQQLKLIEASATKIEQYPIYYLLGVIFMDMSSTHALGYHDTTNRAFSQFRLMGIYCLTMVLRSGVSQLNPDEKRAIAKEICQALLNEECSGQITCRLFGNYCDARLQNLFKTVKAILETKIL